MRFNVYTTTVGDNDDDKPVEVLSGKPELTGLEAAAEVLRVLAEFTEPSTDWAPTLLSIRVDTLTSLQ